VWSARSVASIRESAHHHASVAVLFAFVGIQLAWSLRPFLGDRNQPFRVFGTYQGNFYAAIIYAVNKLMQGTRSQRLVEQARHDTPVSRLSIPLVDTLADTTTDAIAHDRDGGRVPTSTTRS